MQAEEQRVVLSNPPSSTLGSGTVEISTNEGDLVEIQCTLRVAEACDTHTERETDARSVEIHGATSALEPGKNNFHQWRARLVSYTLPCLVYACASMSTTLLNKACVYEVQPHGMLKNYPIFVLFAQHSVTAAIVWLVYALGFLPLLFDGVTAGVVAKWIPLDLLFVGMLLTNMNALHSVSIPMVTVFKSFSTVLTGIGDFAIFGQPLSLDIAGSLLVMVASSLIASFNDLEYNSTGYFWMISNCVLTSTYALYMRMALKAKVSDFTAVFLNNLIALPFLLPFMVLSGSLSSWISR
ncbi:GDP-mannose transporter [Pelomyxa schiedti]|nr:GDP-mannose transporter [Pelomyxa schiedti]